MSRVVFTPSSPAAGLEEAFGRNPMAVVGFCAAWCNTCGAFSDAFEGLARARPDATFVWIDIEDDAHVAGDIDVENFPTIAVFMRGRLVHFGVSLPQITLVSRLLTSLDERSPTVDEPAAVSGILQRLIAADRRPAAST